MDLIKVFNQAAKKYGLPFALFISLLVYVLYENNQREQRYIERENKYVQVIQTLSLDVKERLTKIEFQLSTK